MGLLDIIRRMKLREKQSIREISRHTGLSRNTIAKYLNAGTIEPTFTVPERPSKLDPFADKLAAWLKTEGVPRKQRGRRRKAESLVVVSQSSRVLHGAAGDAMRLDQEIRVLRRQSACKLQLQNVQLKKMLERFER
jgi:transcriptional regulator with XRE-family HTH domain